ncbi:hypothetical protein [Gorillibacterium sp. sgz5001074]|uniref:hypothetical protein n=1 Tax=Gorillibacterium sp. sgz5001074 TaxID=3446695 RepID=UPI003F6644F7
MPYVLQHKDTGELFSCFLTNIYDFRYYGVKVWEDREAAQAELGTITAEHGYDQPWEWEPVELGEDRVKMGNVKLNNNPDKRIYLTPEGKLEARSAT